MSIHVPTGINHVIALWKLQAATHKASRAQLAKHNSNLSFIGVCLSVLYQAATCHRKCHGGPHVLESLCGRTYNLAAAALELTFSGYYDEALNLTRSVGEISNLVSLSVVDKDALGDWLTLDTKARLRKFSPASVRQMLEAKPDGRALMYADKDWYSRFCESYTHVTPKTRPNAHDATAHVGGLYQDVGMNTVVSELGTVLGFVAIIVCRYFQFDDLSLQMKAHLHGDVQSDEKHRSSDRNG